MKMTKENYKTILTVFEDNKELIEKHKQALKENATYKDLNIRLVFDVWGSSLLSREQKDLILQYNTNDELNDNHLKTALIKALTEIGLNEK